MQKYQDVVLKPDGTVIQGASVLVQSYPGAVTSTIYSDDGVTVQANPMTTDGLGRFGFYAANGRYQLVVSGDSVAQYTMQDILLDDGGSTGSWTPDIQWSVPGTATYLANFPYGRYTKIGNLVYVTCALSWSSHTGSGGSGRINGLPFPVLNETSHFPVFSVALIGVNLTAGYIPFAWGQPVLSAIYLSESLTTGFGTNGILFDGAGTVYVSGSYRTA
jgi:hypothetical protein